MKRRSLFKIAASAALAASAFAASAQQTVTLKFHTFMAPQSGVWLNMHKPWMAKVEKELREGDISVQESVRLNSASLRQALGDRYTLFERFVSAFAFEEALALLSQKAG